MTDRCLRGHDAAAAGRDTSGRCLICKREAMRAARAPQREATAAARAERQAAREAELVRVERERIEERCRRQEENERRWEREYQRAIKAGGDVAAEAKWQRLDVQTLDATGSRYSLCQWALEDGNPGACTRRTQDVYCHVHNRQLDRESKRREKQKAIERAPDPPKPRAPRKRPRPPRRPRSDSGWAKYKADHPYRAAFYRSGAWAAARERHLAANPACVVCGSKASVVDHIRSRAEGGADLDPANLQSLCRGHHGPKTLAESHRGMKRAAERRRRGRP